MYHQSGSDGIRVLCTAVLTWRAQSGGATSWLLLRYVASFDISRSAGTSQAVGNGFRLLSNQQVQRLRSCIKTSAAALHCGGFHLDHGHTSDPAAPSAPHDEVPLTAALDPDSHGFGGEQRISTPPAEQYLELTGHPGPSSCGDVSGNRDRSLREPGVRWIYVSGMYEQRPHSAVCNSPVH